MKLTSIDEGFSEKHSSIMAERELSPLDDMEAYGQFFLEYSIMAEYNHLKQENLPGIYAIPSAKSSLVWFCVLFIEQGLYEGAVFKFTLSIPENYPDADCPRITFDSSVFHPLIDPINNELDVRRAFPKWRRNVNHLWHVLMYARKIFHKIDTDSPWNVDAAKLYNEQPDEFKVKVVSCVEACNRQLNDGPKTDDPREILFSDWDEDMHGPALYDMLYNTDCPVQSSVLQQRGLSWMRPGSTDIFSLDENTDNDVLHTL